MAECIRDLKYALLDKEGDEVDKEGDEVDKEGDEVVRSTDTRPVRKAKRNQYCELPGIPQPSLRTGCELLYFILALALFGLIVGRVYCHVGVHGTIPLQQGLESLHLNVSGCDVMFRQVEDGESPGLHYRTWKFMGFAMPEVDGSSIRLTLHNDHRNSLFHCNAVFRLKPGTELANELHVHQVGGLVAVATLGAHGETGSAAAGTGGGSAGLIRVGSRVRFDLDYAQCQIGGLDAPQASFAIRQGLLELQEPHIGKLDVTSVSSPVVVRSTSKPVEVHVPSKDAAHAAFFAGAIDDVQEASGSRPLVAHLAPPGIDSSSAAISAHIESAGAPITVISGTPGEQLESRAGSAHQKPQLLGSNDTLDKVRRFVTQGGSAPILVSVRVIGPSLPHGVWQIMTRKAYLALSVDWLVMISAGALLPRVFSAEVHALGFGLGAKPADVFVLLEEELSDVLSEFPIAWFPTSRDEPVLVYEKSQEHFEERHVKLADVVRLYLCLALNVVGALVISVYMSYLLVRVVKPYIMSRQSKSFLQDSTSYRLSFTPSPPGWRLLATQVDFNRVARVSQPGVLLRWKQRPNLDSFMKYKISCYSTEDGGHNFATHVSKQDLSNSKKNEAEVEYFIAFEEDALHIGETYKFQVARIDSEGNEIDKTFWSHPLHIDHPAAFTDLPFLVAKTFMRPSEQTMSSLEIFCERSLGHKDTCSHIKLYSLRIDLHPSVVDKLQQLEREGMGACLSLMWDGGAEQDSIRLNFKDSKSMPFQRNGRVFTNNNTKPWSLEATRASGEQETLLIRVGTLQGDSLSQIPFTFAEVFKQWEEQRNVYDEAKQQGSDGAAGTVPGFPWFDEVQEQYKNYALSKESAGCRISCWVAFGAKNPCKPSAPPRWMQYPQTPYPNPSSEGPGDRTPADQRWKRAAIRGIYPNEVVSQGASKELWFSEDLNIDGCPVDFIHLELRPTGTNRVRQYQKRLTQLPTPVARGRFIWDVQVNDDGDEEMDGHFVVVAYATGPDGQGQKYAIASVEFLVVRPMLLAEFELGYAAFCRSYQLPMQSFEDTNLEDYGLKVATLPLSVCEGLRPILPAERSTDDRRSLRFCANEDGVVASVRPIELESQESQGSQGSQGQILTPCAAGSLVESELAAKQKKSQGQIFRSTLRMVKVIEGAHWKGMRDVWTQNLLLRYNFDHSWMVAKAVNKPGVQSCVHVLETMMLYFMQIACFLLPPVTAFGLLILHQYWHNTLCFRYYDATPTKKFLTDWLFNPAQLEALLVQSPWIQGATAAIMLYAAFVLVTLVYMNFKRGHRRAVDQFFTVVSSTIIGAVSFVSMLYLGMALLWIVLAVLVNPCEIMPVTVMFSSTILTARKLFRSLATMQRRVKDRVESMTKSLLQEMLDAYIQGQPDLASFSVKAVNIDELDPNKAKFVRCLCELGEEVSVLPKGRSPDDQSSLHATIQDGGESEEEDEALHAEQQGLLAGLLVDNPGGASRGDRTQLPDGLRKQLLMCFHHSVDNIPLPHSMQQSLSDPRRLANTCIERRDEMLQEMLGDDGKSILREKLEQNLDTKLSSSIVTVLQRAKGSQISLMDHGTLSNDAALFYDRELAEQILSMVHTRLTDYHKTLKADTKRLFDCFRHATEDQAHRQQKQKELESYCARFEELLTRHKIDVDICVHEVDTTGDGIAEYKLLPCLQALGILPPFDLLEGTVLTEKKEGLETLLRYLTVLVTKVTDERLTILHRHHVKALMLQIVDHAGDGHVDHLWWSCFVQICQDIYILHGKDPKDSEASYPCELAQLVSIWVDETVNHPSGLALLPLHRIEDIILAKLMSPGGVRKIWREAFVLLSRHLHVWPEIPLDDTVIEVKSRNSKCNALNIFSSLQEPERDAQLNGILEGAKKGLDHTSPMPPKLGETLVYTDEEDLVFADFGDFGPDKGFTFLHHPRADLKTAASDTWVSLTWDAHAKVDASCPPFMGPLTVYLVFMNLNPDTPHENRPWLKLEGWQLIEGKRVPTVMQQNSREMRRWLKIEGWQSVKGKCVPTVKQYTMTSNEANHGFPSDRIRGLGPVMPNTEVYRKTFGLVDSQEDIVELKGMNSGSASTDSPPDPVFVFFQVERLQMPDAQSFDDAHHSFFGRSALFKNLWDFYDKSEVIREADKERQKSEMQSSSKGSSQLCRKSSFLGGIGAAGIGSAALMDLKKTNGKNMINLALDCADLMQSIFLERCAMDHPPEPCEKNSNLKMAHPELMELANLRAERHTGKRKCVWFQPLGQEFYMEDMTFDEFDVAEYQQFRFQATMRRADAGSGTSHSRVNTCVKAIALLRDGKIVHKAANPQEDSQGGIIINFKTKTIIDQLNFVTFGLEDDPMRWTISGRNTPSDKWKVLGNRTQSYPLGEGSELVEIGKKQAGGIWHREGNDWLKLRGLWFDAFHELLGALGLRVDRLAAWSLWRVILSAKHEPMVYQHYPGFVTIADVKASLLQVMYDDPFLSEDLFSWWNVESRLALQEINKRKVYASICAKTPDFHGAPNLVRWMDLSRSLRTWICKSKPYLEKRSATGRTTSSSKQYIVGSLWFEALYEVITSSMPERYSREEVMEHYIAYSNPGTGLLPIHRTFDVIAKLGRRGLKMMEFWNFIKNLGMKIDQQSLRLVFYRVDTDHSLTMDADEIESAVTLLMSDVLPREVLEREGLSTEHIVRHVAFWLLILLVVFFFIGLSFMALLNGEGSGAAVSFLQSMLAGFAALGVMWEGSRDTSKTEVHDVVDNSLEASLGSSARLASQREAAGSGGTTS